MTEDTGPWLRGWESLIQVEKKKKKISYILKSETFKNMYDDGIK